jgi:hypothetical protein
VTIESTFLAANMDVGKYELICACIGGFLPTDMKFEVVESGPSAIERPSVANDESLEQNNAWYDLQGRKLPGKPTEPGLYIVGGNKVLVK